MNIKHLPKKITVTIGIPAYNEENNISKLLDSILYQKGDFFIINKIIVVSDYSQDKTDKIVLSYKNKGVDLIKNTSRKGQIYAQNLIFKLAKTDVVVLFEADTFPTNNDYLLNLLHPLVKDKNIGLVQGNMIPLSAKTFLEKVLIKQYSVYSKIVLKDILSKNPIPSGRGGRAFSKFVYKKLVWPNSVPEDEYAYLWCVSNNIKLIFCRNAICQYRLPQKFKDFLRETQKNKSASDAIKKYYKIETINKAMKLSIAKRVLIFISLFLESPILSIAYITFRLRVNFELNNKAFTDF